MGAGWSEVGVEGVPLELVYRILRHVSLRDLTTLSATSYYLRSLIDESPLLWSHVHTKELWPSEKTWHWFERAAHCGNVGASIKLAVALLYNEGVMLGKPVLNGALAVTLFERLETGGTLGPRSQLWLLYRPPWGAQPLCCKRYVHMRISHIAQMTGASWAVRVLSRISEVVGEGDSSNDPFAVNWVKVAAQGGDLHARLLQWCSRYERRHQEGVLDPGTELQASRELRELCLTGYYPTALSLSQFLATSRHPSNHCLPEIREFLQSSPPSRTWYALNYQLHVTPHMHHVLVDWLCEVANMKLHSSRVLHAATQIVEAYLSVEQVKLNQLQLVGITAILLATRFIPGASILTICEASWVTDNTYSYSYVVRTIGHIMAALKANLAFPTILDYATVLLEAVKAPVIIQEWTRFLCDLATTCSFPPQTTLAQIGSSCVLLGYILSRLPWPNLTAVSGFTQPQLLQPALIIYSKNFDIEGSKCQRRGILDRYSLVSLSTEQVGLLPVPPLEDFLPSLSLTETDYIQMVTVPPNLRDNVNGVGMDGDSSGSGTMCNERRYRPQQMDKSPPQQFDRLQEPVPHQLRPSLEPPKTSSEFAAGNNSLACGSGNWNVGNCRDVSLGSRAKADDGKMECSESDLSQESSDMGIPIIKDPSCLRTSTVHSDSDGEGVPSRPKSLRENNESEDLPSSGPQEQAGNVTSPIQRECESLDDNTVPSELMLEDPNETTDSEEYSDFIPGSCEDVRTKNARVSLKRKLENASEGERSEKCLILDVGNLQLS